MSRYDGLIIPRSYSDYINKTDAATLSQALQLPGVMDAAPTENTTVMIANAVTGIRVNCTAASDVINVAFCG